MAVADVFRGVAVSARVAHPTDALGRESGFASMILLYAMTLAIVFFLVWLSRCRRNAEYLFGASVAPGGWAVVVWFIPVINWWVPRQIVLDIERASSGTSQKGGDTVLVNIWWVVWAAHSAVVLVWDLIGRGTSTPVIVVSEGLDIAAAVLAICVIERITALQGAALRTMSPVEPLAHA
ncbi:DUF4328 domain-containing protein [Actinacidiphila oryziradicis]|uniref:DUF4328 domain-containing protein n=1 Tax=Actinacidiphila oryziradicis TaxID=2571141 RepID=UPI001FE33FAB|nr:DUF4328 domain-containing protein [Actinacidiphila oryziradicis]